MFHGGVRTKKVIFSFSFDALGKNFFLSSVGWMFGFWVHTCSGHVPAFENRLYTKFPAISLLHVLLVTSGCSVIFSCPQHFGSQGLNLLWNQSGFRMKGALGWTFPWDKVRGPGPSGPRSETRAMAERHWGIDVLGTCDGAKGTDVSWILNLELMLGRYQFPINAVNAP